MSKNFEHNVKVYYEDTDAGGVVYYSNYLNYLERARTEAIKAIGLSNNILKNDYGIFIIVKSCNIEYKKPAHLEDELVINSIINNITKTSFLMNQTIKKQEEIITSALIHLVIVDKEGKPKRIPDILLNNLKSYIEN